MKARGWKITSLFVLLAIVLTVLSVLITLLTHVSEAPKFQNVIPESTLESHLLLKNVTDRSEKKKETQNQNSENFESKKTHSLITKNMTSIDTGNGKNGEDFKSTPSIPELAIIEDDYLDNIPKKYNKTLIDTFKYGDCKFKYYEVTNIETSVKSWFYGGIQMNQLPSKVIRKQAWERRSFRQDHALKLAPLMHKLFNHLGIVYHIVSGLSLGLCRYRRPLPWDGDIDFHASKEGYEKLVEFLYHIKDDKNVKPGEKIFKGIYKSNFTSKHPLFLCNYAPKKLDVHVEKCVSLIIDGVKVKLVIWFEDSVTDMIKFASSNLIRETNKYDPYSTVYLDVFMCRKTLCQKQKRDRPFRAKELDETYTCNNLNVTYMCGGVHGRKNLYGEGPFDGESFSKYPEVKICGSTMRIDGLWFKDKDRYCKLYSDVAYGFEKGRAINISPHLEKEVYVPIAKDYSIKRS